MYEEELDIVPPGILPVSLKLDGAKYMSQFCKKAPMYVVGNWVVVNGMFPCYIVKEVLNEATNKVREGGEFRGGQKP